MNKAVYNYLTRLSNQEKEFLQLYLSTAASLPRNVSPTDFIEELEEALHVFFGISAEEEAEEEEAEEIEENPRPVILRYKRNPSIVENREIHSLGDGEHLFKMIRLEGTLIYHGESPLIHSYIKGLKSLLGDKAIIFCFQSGNTSTLEVMPSVFSEVVDFLERKVLSLFKENVYIVENE